MQNGNGMAQIAAILSFPLFLPSLMSQSRNPKTIDFWVIKAKMALVCAIL